MVQARSLTANFSIKSYTLSLSANLGGSVFGAGSFNHGQQATIQATAQSGFVFDSWSKSGVSMSLSPSTTILMDNDKNWTANFIVQPSNTYSLILSSNPASAGTTTGAGGYARNALTPVSATPNTGYQFAGWTGAGVTNQDSNSTTVTMNQDRNLTANFSLKSYSLNLTASTGGSISGAGTFNHGTNPTISATPNIGYIFTNWTVAGVVYSDSNSTTVSMNQDRNLTANFLLKSYSLNLTAGLGGSISASGTFNHGTNPSVTATPNTGYIFSNWTDAGVVYSDSNSTTVSMNQDRNLTANFSLLTFKLALKSSEGGTVSGDGDFNFGSTATYNATAESGYTFKNWTIADQNFSNQSSGSIEISSSLILTAHFEKSLDPALSSAQSLGNNIFSSWLGYFLTFDNGWYYHLKLGWIYPQGDSSNGLWFWSSDAGWFWTNEEIFEESFLWSTSDNDWVFIQEGDTVGDTLLYSYKKGGGWNYLPGTTQAE